MSFASKPPPRYVPTLTEVVTDPEPPAPGRAEPEATLAPPAFEPVAHAPELSSGVYDRLPEAEPEPEPEPAWPLPAKAPVVDNVSDVEAWLRAEEALVQRLLQRVDQVLDQRLRDTIAQVVQAQTRSLTLRLQEELESVVRQTVQEAVAQERATPGAGR